MASDEPTPFDGKSRLRKQTNHRNSSTKCNEQMSSFSGQLSLITIILKEEFLFGYYSQISSDISVMQSLFRKFSGNHIIRNKNFTIIDCSQYEIENNKCEDYKIQLKQRNRFYINQWFDRFFLTYEELPQTNKELLVKSISFLFYSKFVQLSKQKSLLSISQILQVFNNTLSTVSTPMVSKFIDSPTRDTCVEEEGIYNFDPRCVEWYQEAIHSEKIQIIEPVVYYFRKQVFFYESKRITQESDPIQSIISVNIEFTNFMEKILKIQDQSQSKSTQSEGYNLLMHAKKGQLIYHRNWDPSSGVKLTWPEAEFPKNESFLKDEVESFTARFNSILEICKKQIFSIESNQEQNPNFTFDFTKQGIPFIASVLPVEISFLNQNEPYQSYYPLIMGRIDRDTHESILEQSLQFNSLHLCLSIIGSTFIGFVLFIAGIHLFAVLYRSIDIPISLLISFLNFQDSNLRELQDNQITPRRTNRFEDVELSFASSVQNSYALSRFNPNPQFSKSKIRTTRSQYFKNAAKMCGSVVNSNENLINQVKNRTRSKSDRNDNVLLSLESSQGILSKRKQEVRNHRMKTLSVKDDSQIEAVPSIIENTQQLVELEDIQSGFQEMSVIIDVFQKMEIVIKSAIVSDVTGDSDNSLISYSTLYQMYRRSNNLQGMSNCQTTIGLIYLKKNAFTEASRILQIALKLTLSAWFGVDSIHEFELQFSTGNMMNFSEAQIKKLIYRLRIYSLALLLECRSNTKQKNLNQNKNQILLNARRHIKLASRMCDSFMKWNLEGRKIISLLLVEIEIEIGNQFDAFKELIRIPQQDFLFDCLSSYHSNLIVKLLYSHDYLNTATFLTSILENSFYYDSYQINQALLSLQQILNKHLLVPLTDQASLCIQKEIKSFEIKQFELFFFINNSQFDEEAQQSIRLIRQIINEFCIDEDTFNFFKFNNNLGIQSLESGKIKQKELLETCILNLLPGIDNNEWDRFEDDPLSEIQSMEILRNATRQTIENSSKLEQQIRGQSENQLEKILLIFDQSQDIQKYEGILSELFLNESATFIHISQNPCDIIKRLQISHLYYEVNQAQSDKDVLKILNRMRQKFQSFSSLFLC